MSHELIEAAREFQAATTKTADIQGPFGWMGDVGVQIWVEMDSYGRVHHVVGDLKKAEKLVEKYRSALVDAQRDLGELGVIFNTSDVIIDGMPGGRNRMIAYIFFGRRGDKWSEEAMDAISDAIGMIRWKAQLPKTH